MAELLAPLLRGCGGCLSSELATQLVASGKFTPAAARKRVSRLEPDVMRLAYVSFPRNARFIYLRGEYGSREFWNALIQALLETGSALGLGLLALQKRGGLIPVDHFAIACGAPLRQAKHLSPETVLNRLKQANLVGEYEVPGVGACIALTQGPDRYDQAANAVRARLIAEEILLKALKMWIRRLGLGSYDKVAVRGDSEVLPRVGTFAWDLTAPSYLAPMVERDKHERLKPGFIACDILLDTTVDENALRPFLSKASTLRSLRRVGRCLHIFVADRYTPDAFALARKRGIIPATPESLFGKEVAEGLSQLTSVLRETASLVTDQAVLFELFDRLGRIEGAANNLRGALFEFVAADIVRQAIAPLVLMNEIVRDEESGQKREIDVIAEAPHRSVHFVECKGYQPFGTVPDKYVTDWLEKTVPVAYKYAKRHSVWKDLALSFEFWTTGKLSEQAKAEVSRAAARVRKYTVGYREAAAVRDLARSTKDSALVAALDQHFLSHPVAGAARARRQAYNDRPAKDGSDDCAC